MLYDSKHRRPVQIGPRCRHDGGPRNGRPRVIVIHSAEAPSNAAPGVARYGAWTDRSVSWHVVCDNNILIRQLPDGVISWTAPGANHDGLHIELCGYARYSTLEWYRNQATLKRAAWQVARWCVKHEIPPRWLSNVELAGGRERGLVTHAQVSKVFKRSDHWDPGPNFPLGRFLRMVRRRIGQLEKERP